MQEEIQNISQGIGYYTTAIVIMIGAGIMKFLAWLAPKGFNLAVNYFNLAQEKQFEKIWQKKNDELIEKIDHLENNLKIYKDDKHSIKGQLSVYEEIMLIQDAEKRNMMLKILHEHYKQMNNEKNN